MTKEQLNAQLRVLTSAQVKVRLEALGLSSSGKKPVLLRKLKIALRKLRAAYGHKPDVEPLDIDLSDNELSDDDSLGYLETWRDACARVVRLDQVLAWTGADAGRAYARPLLSSS